MKKPLALMFLVVLIAGGIALYLLHREPEPTSPDEPVATREAPPEAPGVPAAGGTETPARGAAAEEEPAAAEMPAEPIPDTGTAALPPGYPRSEVPHQVVNAWGRDETGSPKRVVGMSILVDPSTSTAELTRLAEDVLAANCDAPMVSVRIFDSEVAFDSEKYERHDPIIADHTIGQIWVNPGENRYRPRVRVKIRGEDVLLGEDAIPAGDACEAGS